MLMTAAAPPNKAAIPIAPVSIGRHAPPELDVAVALASAEATDSVAMDEVGVATPEVNGSVLALLALGKACSVADVSAVFGAAVLFIGLRTRSMTWTTPLRTRTFGVMTRAWLT